MKKTAVRALAVALAIALIGPPTYSQIRETGTIHGYIQDEQNQALPGATVKISGPNLIGGERSYISDQRGYYRFPNLPVGSYTVFVELSGFAKIVREISRLSANQSLTVDFNMKPTAVNEVITVTASAPTVDITSSSSGSVVLSDSLLLALPVAKELGGLMGQTPGIEGRTAFGMDNESNGYYFDGINVSSPTGAGSWEGGMRFSPDFNIIQEASVSAIGLNAEFGGFTGAVLQAISKSGSNKFSGLFETSFNGRDWNSQNLGAYSADQFYDPASKDAKFEAGSYLDVGLQAGGKIIQDKLWFFLSGQYDGTKKYPLGYSGVQSGTNWKGFVKLSSQVARRMKMNLSASYDNERTINAGALPMISPEADVTWRNPGFLVNLNTMSVLSSNSVFELKFGYNKKNSFIDPNSGLDVSSHFDLLTGRMTGNFDSFRKYYDKMGHFSAHLSQFFPQLLIGSHDTKIGAEIIFAKPDILFGKPGGANYFDYGGQPMYMFTMDPMAQEMDHTYSEATMFAQDSWSVNKRLTLNLGLRFDAYSYKIPTAELGNVYKNNNLAPRLGLAFDLFGDRKNVLKFSYGHYYDKVKDSLFSAADSRTATNSMYLWTGTEWMLLFTQKADTSYIHIDPGIKQAYIREMSVAFERELFRDASLSVTYYDRKAARFMGMVEMVGVWQDLVVTNPGLDGVVGTPDDLGPITLHDRLNPDETYYLLTNPYKGQSTAMLDDPKYRAQGLEVVFAKKYSHRWQMVASYHYTKAKGNTSSTFTSLGTGQESFVNAYGEVGYLYGQPHQFKLQASSLLPWDVEFGLIAQYSSGYAKNPNYYDFGTYGSIGYPVVPPGTYHYQPKKQVDLRAQKQFKLGDGRLSLMADVFNLFNANRVLSSDELVGATYDLIYTVQSPRVVRVGVRYQY
jgi:outer membrane receptor protein involved in Fe transport